MNQVIKQAHLKDNHLLLILPRHGLSRGFECQYSVRNNLSSRLKIERLDTKKKFCKIEPKRYLTYKDAKWLLFRNYLLFFISQFLNNFCGYFENTLSWFFADITTFIFLIVFNRTIFAKVMLAS